MVRIYPLLAEILKIPILQNKPVRKECHHSGWILFQTTLLLHNSITLFQLLYHTEHPLHNKLAEMILFRLTASHKRYSMLGIASYDNHYTSFHHANSLLEAGNCIPYTNNSGSRAIDPLVDLVSQQQPLPEIKRCISRYTTPHDCELTSLDNIYSANTANAPMYRVTTSRTPPEPDLQSSPWQLDDIPAAQNGTILPP
ncbi:uncharacterized protein EAE97_007128 [Botrytis byssoidea]|uniref:Uncharacterized protein n=1 Tax=Botrytis byssoidea TaxID=139641 RepID=A0A9P5M274_9HELO|nr:uncharacterized protein EAE97_007128 [Botrytis byssoidea]KAF7940943.1 hypothetical protein EAE97_007128 [Botrytis byssoidea]